MIKWIWRNLKKIYLRYFFGLNSKRVKERENLFKIHMRKQGHRIIASRAFNPSKILVLLQQKKKNKKNSISSCGTARMSTGWWHLHNVHTVAYNLLMNEDSGHLSCLSVHKKMDNCYLHSIHLILHCLLFTYTDELMSSCQQRVVTPSLLRIFQFPSVFRCVIGWEVSLNHKKSGKRQDKSGCLGGNVM